MNQNVSQIFIKEKVYNPWPKINFCSIVSFIILTKIYAEGKINLVFKETITNQKEDDMYIYYPIRDA